MSATRGSTNQATTRELYDLVSPDYVEVFGHHLHDGYHVTGDEPREQAQEKLVEVLADRIDLGSGDRVLDVGCGVGGPAEWLARRHGCAVTGITNSAVQARLAALHARAACFAVMDAERLAFQGGSFDAVVLIGVLGHLDDQRRFLADVRDVLRPGGALAVADWVLAPGRSVDEVASVAASLGMPEVHSAAEIAGWLDDLGWIGVAATDETAHMAPGWGIAPADVTRVAFWRLVRKLGPRVVSVLRGARSLGRAIEDGSMRYAMITARAG